jgi:hypothetical protein
MRRFLSILTIILKVIVLIGGAVLTCVAVYIFCNGFQRYVEATKSAEEIKNGWLNPDRVKNSVALAEEKLALKNNELIAVADKKKQEEKYNDFIKKIEGKWTYTVEHNKDCGDEDRRDKSYDATIKGKTLTINFEGNTVKYTLNPYYDSINPSFSICSYDDGENTFMDLEIGESDDELRVYGQYCESDEPEEMEEDDGPGRGDAPSGMIAKLIRK